MISTRLQGMWRLSSCQRMILSQPSRQAPFEPGKAKMNLPRATPAQARDCSVERPTLSITHHVPNDCEALDLLFEQRAQRLWRDVPPGKTGAAGRDDDIDIRRRRATRPLGRELLRHRRGQARARRYGGHRVLMRSASSAPEVSLSSSRVSETVSTATRTGLNGSDSSIRHGRMVLSFRHAPRAAGAIRPPSVRSSARRQVRSRVSRSARRS